MRFPKRPPQAGDGAILAASSAGQTILDHVSPVLADGRYLHWNELRFRKPPAGLSTEQWWFAQKLGRRASRVEVKDLTDATAKPFWFCRLEAIERATHELDRNDTSRELRAALGDDGAREAYRIDQLIEEAISSSVLEGAKLTTRAEAKEIIREGRPPANQSERMVVNNYRAMRRLLDMAHRTLTMDDLLEIHAVLGEDSLDVPNAAGRLRTASESVRIEDALTGETWFTPPPADDLPQLLVRMLAFANDAHDANHEDDSSAHSASDTRRQFLHPLVRAIILHFWTAYLHPFVDGNGRMARALFYWQMLRSGYDFAQYLSISGPIDRSRRAYYLSFAYTETDDGDLTYFLLHQLAVLRQAKSELVEHLHERSQRLRELSSAVEGTEALNHRQQSALLFVRRNPHIGLTVNGHMTSHAVSYLTARKDLQELESRGYLRRVRVGRTDKYLPRGRSVPPNKSKRSS
jgi:Fic family protein